MDRLDEYDPPAMAEPAHSGGTIVSASGAEAGTFDSQDRCLDTTVNSSGTSSFRYDELGNLLGATLANGTDVDYSIDGTNRRVGRTVNGQRLQRLLYSGMHPVAELDPDGNVTSRFVYGTRGNIPDLIIKGDTTYRVIADHLGSPRLIVNVADGTIAQRMDFDEFGNITRDTAPSFQPFVFAGGLGDRDAGLVRFGARDYDPQTGRFVSKDPILFDGGDTNLYGYVMNDPINLTDPSGLTWTSNWNLFWDWVEGNGAAKRNYGPNSVESQEMRQSPGAAKMRRAFYKGHCRSAKGLSYATVPAYWDTIANPRTADWASTAAQAGGFAGASVANNGNGTATFTIPNVAGTHSFFLHAVPDRKSPTGMMSNINQQFTWTEPIAGGSCGCP